MPLNKDNVDQVAAAKANLELMLAENSQLRSYFGEVLEKLTQLETLPPEERREQFRAIERRGDLNFNGLDIRHFAQNAPARALTPPEFLQRTRRRLRNTHSLVEEFIKRSIFKEGKDLKEQLDALIHAIVNAGSAGEVREFRRKVEGLRQSATFTLYLETKRQYIKRDPEIKADSDFIAAKESAEEGIETLQKREADLMDIGSKMERGELSADEAQVQLDELALSPVT
ncbi:MAG TPA: hypothetical protein VL359_01330 [bacterium]|nr:hypothetical protein [bacterium]